MKRLWLFLLLCTLCVALAGCGVEVPNGPEKAQVSSNDGELPPPPPPPPNGNGGG